MKSIHSRRSRHRKNCWFYILLRESSSVCFSLPISSETKVSFFFIASSRWHFCIRCFCIDLALVCCFRLICDCLHFSDISWVLTRSTITQNDCQRNLMPRILLTNHKALISVFFIFPLISLCSRSLTWFSKSAGIIHVLALAFVQ